MHRKTEAVPQWLRTCLDTHLLHAGVLRSESTRKIELPDLALHRLGHEAADNDVEVPCLVVGLVEGKTLPVGAVDYTAILRHKDPLLCPVSSLAKYLFVRYELNHEKPPDLTDRKSWYTTKLLLGKDPTAPLSYETQAQWIRKAFNEAGISSKKVTHTMRGASARYADAYGVPEDQVILSSLFFFFLTNSN